MGFNTLQCSSRQRPRLEIRRLKKNISFDRSTEKGVLDYLFSDSKDRQVDHRMDRLVWVAVNFWRSLQMGMRTSAGRGILDL